MKPFLDENFLLHNDTAAQLYHNHAATQPIIDYHCHLDPQMIADNRRFTDLTEIWLAGDHYKWRAMRANGIPEDYITGSRPSFDKFMRWAETIPYTMRNPLYHWTHLELSRIFGINKILNPVTAHEIYHRCTEMLQDDTFRARAIMERMNVRTVCTTDDPVDSLAHHQAIRQSGFSIKVLPTWRPDKAMAVDNPEVFNAYIDRLEEASGMDISTFDHLIQALRKRHDYFADNGCTVSDHGIESFYDHPYTDAKINAIFLRACKGDKINQYEIGQFRHAIMYEGALMDHEAGWVQQFHVGPLRNNNTAIYRRIGPDAGCDSMHDRAFAAPMNRFLDRLSSQGRLAKTILYNLNPKDSAMMASTAYNFNDGTVPGKIQYGAGWWFLDQIRGMEEQMNTLSALGLLSRFVGMLTDSRSFLSYPRHEYFRRILCNLIGREVESGELPSSELLFIGDMVEGISYRNAKEYFGW